jgi:hypothetical protein
MPVRETADERTLEAVLASGPAFGPGVSLWRLGQAGFLVQAAGRSLVVDPYLSDFLSRKYAGKFHPHIRMMPSSLPPSRARSVDLALLPINGRDEARRSTGIPSLLCHHYGMFDFNTTDLAGARTRLAEMRTGVQVLFAATALRCDLPVLILPFGKPDRGRDGLASARVSPYLRD